MRRAICFVGAPRQCGCIASLRLLASGASAPATDRKKFMRPNTSASGESEQAVVVDRSSHSISRRRIPENVLKVLYRLHRSGYRAYLCGGSVRDLLMNRTPKDFDVATDAHPAEIRRLFRNSRIIGRRFRLVHVIFQDMIVEVSTFRREPERPSEENAELLITNDNTFGTP